jgi:hypothetical protein
MTITMIVAGAVFGTLKAESLVVKVVKVERNIPCRGEYSYRWKC